MLLAELGANASLAHSLVPRERHLTVDEYRRLHLPQFETRSLQIARLQSSTNFRLMPQKRAPSQPYTVFVQFCNDNFTSAAT